MRPTAAATEPVTSARYVFLIRRALSCAWSEACAASVRATMSSPLVSRSRRWTMPGRCTPAMPAGARSAPRPRSAFTSVPASWPGDGMHDEARRLVDDQQVVVLVHDVDRDLRLRDRRRRRRRRDSQLQRRAAADDRVRLDRLSVDREPALADEALHVAPATARSGPSPSGRHGPGANRAGSACGGRPHVALHVQAWTATRRANDGQMLAARSSRMAKLIAASATLKVYQRRSPMPASTKSTT